MTRSTEDAVFFVLMAFAGVLASMLVVGLLHDGWFWSRHDCVRSASQWQSGHFVGIPGKGGGYQPGRYRDVCQEWTPKDGAPWFR